MPRTRLRAEHLEDRVTPVTLPPGFAESVFASGLTAPTAMAVAPDGRVFVAEQGGTLRVAQNGTVLPTPFVSLAVDSTGERGLIGVALDPNFATNHFVYGYYTVPGTPAHNRVSRFTAVGDAAFCSGRRGGRAGPTRRGGEWGRAAGGGPERGHGRGGGDRRRDHERHPRVGIYKVGSGTAAQLGSFLAFPADITGGVFVG
ncbi:MAG TPA: PQQ-dependent sugar dehydrogenase [Gemmataceae bacterium]|nr:PQQ-dependent sugar dehydrogenase [Gemmataceae bacterium]